MWILMVEAGVALFLLVFIVWWTMYSGQKPNRDERHDQDVSGKDKSNEAAD